MGKVTGFLEYEREIPTRRPPAERIKDWFEIYQPFPEDKVRVQAARKQFEEGTWTARLDDRVLLIRLARMLALARRQQIHLPSSRRERACILAAHAE